MSHSGASDWVEHPVGISQAGFLGGDHPGLGIGSDRVLGLWSGFGAAAAILILIMTSTRIVDGY
jgi:hypothetical protein